MRKLRMVRICQNEEGAMGTLQIDGVLHCLTLEPDINDDHPQILAGIYKCRRFHGTTWVDTFEILVPGHTAVLFHVGNTEDDSKMCVLLGMNAGKLKDKVAVLNSGVAFREFMKKLDKEQELELTIVECY